MPYGRLAVRIEHWPRLVEAAVGAGILPERQAPVTIAALDLVAAGGAPGVLETELVLEEGRVRLGPIPLGRAPPTSAAVGPRTGTARVSRWKWSRWNRSASGPSTVPKGPQAERHAARSAAREDSARQPCSTVTSRPLPSRKAEMSMALPLPCSLIRPPGRLLRGRQA